MPRYDYRCSKCGLEFEVSRPMSQSSDPAVCPNDGTESERVFTMPVAFVKGQAGETPPLQPSAGHDHGHGHSHGPGTHVH
jgi:putative FmdB family regulatory protein